MGELPNQGIDLAEGEGRGGVPVEVATDEAVGGAAAVQGRGAGVIDDGGAVLLDQRQDRLLERRLKQAGFRDPGKTLDTFDFDFNKKMNRSLVFELATGRFITQREDGPFLGPPESAT